MTTNQDIVFKVWWPLHGPRFFKNSDSSGWLTSWFRENYCLTPRFGPEKSEYRKKLMQNNSETQN
jgi:hypothetical protein